MIGLVVFLLISVGCGISFTRDDFGTSYTPTAGEAVCRFVLNTLKAGGITILVGVVYHIVVFIIGTMILGYR